MHISKEIQTERRDDAEENDACRKDVQHQTVAAYGIHEAGAYLHADRVNEEDEAEFLDKVENVAFNAETEVSEQDAHEESPCAPEADSLDLDLADHEADGCREGDGDNLLGDGGLCE